jgi:iron complex outermembrane recepter protein
MKKQLITLFAVTSASLAWSQTSASALSERDYLGDVPIVLSVSRLAQPLDEAPGAVTVLDRDFIRMSGARDVADLLRMVPGFQTTTSFETDAPLATYHGRSDDWANRIQVLVDGRSVYSGHLQGSVGMGLQTLAIDDIARIEILRGSNSASYGARAFLGVINIISRDVRDTIGSSGYVNAGDQGVADTGARLGWGSVGANYRISADTRGDNGLRGAFGANRVTRLNGAATLDFQGGGELDLRLGGLSSEAGRGTPGDAGNNARMWHLSSQYVQGDWRIPSGPDQDWLISYSHTENIFNDRFPLLTVDYGLKYYGIPIDFGGREENDALSVQHTVRASDTVRVVWGSELRREEVTSPSSFDGRNQVTNNFTRLFGNVEWRLQPQWVLNAGALAEQSNIGGNSVSPRLMLNWHVVPGHTLRAGVSTAFRPPSAFEKYAAVRYYDVNGQNPITTVLSSGSVGSEKIYTRELGYNFSLDRNTWSGDVRFFEENVTDGIERTAGRPVDTANTGNMTITGMEYQVQWRPQQERRVFFTQSWTDIAGSDRFKTAHGAPHYAASIALMQQFSNRWNASVMFQLTDGIAMSESEKRLYTMSRTDLRIGKQFRWGRNQAELALTVQNLDAPYRDGGPNFFFDRRAMVSLRIEN